MSIKQYCLMGLSLLLLGGSTLHQLVLAWDWEHALGSPTWNLLLVRVSRQDTAQNTVQLTPLAPEACKAVVEQDKKASYDPQKTWCAPLTCPGAGAYSILLQAEDSLPSNVVVFGLDSQCGAIDYGVALALAIPGAQHVASLVAPATTPAPSQPATPAPAPRQPATPPRAPNQPAPPLLPSASTPAEPASTDADLANFWAQAETLTQGEFLAPTGAQNESPTPEPSTRDPGAVSATSASPSLGLGHAAPTLTDLQTRFADVETAYQVAQDQIAGGYETLRRQCEEAQRRRQPGWQQKCAALWAEYQKASDALLQAYQEALAEWQTLMERWQAVHAPAPLPLPSEGLPTSLPGLPPLLTIPPPLPQRSTTSLTAPPLGGLPALPTMPAPPAVPATRH